MASRRTEWDAPTTAYRGAPRSSVGPWKFLLLTALGMAASVTTAIFWGSFWIGKIVSRLDRIEKDMSGYDARLDQLARDRARRPRRGGELAELEEANERVENFVLRRDLDEVGQGNGRHQVATFRTAAVTASIVRTSRNRTPVTGVMPTRIVTTSVERL